MSDGAIISDEDANALFDDQDDAGFNAMPSLRIESYGPAARSAGLWTVGWKPHGVVVTSTILPKELPPPDDCPVSKINRFSVRVANCLKNENFETAGDVRRCPDWRLLQIPNFGRRSLSEVRSVLPYYHDPKRDRDLISREAKKIAQGELARRRSFPILPPRDRNGDFRDVLRRIKINKDGLSAQELSNLAGRALDDPSNWR